MGGVKIYQFSIEFFRRFMSKLLMRNAIWRERDIWLSNHADIKATINNAIKYFLCLESFGERNLLESRSLRPGRFRDSSNGLWETFIFQLFPRILNVIKGKVGESIFAIIIVAPLEAIMKPRSSDLG